MIISTSKDLYYKFISDLFNDVPMRIYILTYGLWCGINAQGKCVANTNSYHVLNYLNRYSEYCKTTIVVGYNSQLSDVVIATAKYFGNIEFIAVNQMHSKCILTSTGILSVGSSNFNDSSWPEINSYCYINTDDEIYEIVHGIIESLCQRGEKINPSDYESIDISKIVSDTK